MMSSDETLHLWIFKRYIVKILIRMRECVGDLNLHWAHMSKGMFSDAAIQLLFCEKSLIYCIRLNYRTVHLDFSKLLQDL